MTAIYSQFVALARNCPTQSGISISDHSSIITSININATIDEPESSIENNPLSRPPMQFLWENDSASKFKDVWRSPDLQMLIRDYLDDDNSFLDVNTKLKC